MAHYALHPEINKEEHHKCLARNYIQYSKSNYHMIGDTCKISTMIRINLFLDHEHCPCGCNMVEDEFIPTSNSKTFQEFIVA